jgi:MOSC domain-containing protein YiiM
MTSPTLLSIQVGKPQTMAYDDPRDGRSREWTSGIYKRTVSGPVWLGRLNLDGDGQADLSVHGGVDKAVMGYCAEHYPFWREKLPGTPFEFGAFGENFTISGMSETSACMEDIYRVGEALIQVSAPRGPCWKLARKIGNNQIGKMVIGSGYSGWYFRVLEEGVVEAGQTFELVERPAADWSIKRYLDDVVYA